MRGSRAASIAAIAFAAFGSGADCGTAPGPVPERDFAAELFAPHVAQQDRRSQPVPPPPLHWEGTDQQVFVEMVAPAGFQVRVADAAGEPVGDACVFLDAPGQLGDVAATTVSATTGDLAGTAEMTVIPATYDVVIAKECLLGTSAAVRQEGVVFGSDAAQPIQWTLPATGVFHGKVQYDGGAPIEGAVVTLFDSADPDRPTGLTAVSDHAGLFSLQVPDGTWHVLTSAPADGSVPIPPIRVDNQQLPYVDPENTTLVVRYPAMQPGILAGEVYADDLTYTRARILIEGWVSPGPEPGQFTGGLFRAETSTDQQGRFEMEVPPGSYTIQAWPAYDDTDCAPEGEDSRFCYGATSDVREVGAGALVDDVRLQLQAAKIARIEVREPDGTPLAEATLLLRQLTAPHFSYRRRTSDAFDGWVGLLPAAIYEVEVIPPTDAESGVKRYARARAALDLTTSQSILQVYLQRSDVFEGFVYGPGGDGVPEVRVLMIDPATDAVLDETVTNGAEDTPGFFRGILPRP